ncbi:hypothetical protein HBI56_127130 [Parastagonospora nodorum]|nr:hypothetical protein HBH53_106350 [Parastagonospora nodorum]KAH3997277.1 hypothetical protein HBI10_145300 [Parastagonospora nodorum]KAH4019834.1 hypothetical protein HBI13_118450 [Parastagonospora nodorum]KAH4026308.1 hypothetical protein HBI09_151340 [Parastagonospora nodorum]KAH4118728.1 hypothetical protein HBH47_135230 [Parastagonospora nodorum]
MAEAIGAIELASFFTQASEAATETQKLLSQYKLTKQSFSDRLRDAELRVQNFRASLDKGAAVFMVLDYTHGSSRFNNLIDHILKDATILLDGICKILDRQGSLRSFRLTQSEILRVSEITNRLNELADQLQHLVVQLSFESASPDRLLERKHHGPVTGEVSILPEHAATGEVSVPHEEHPAPGSSALPDREGADCYSEHASKKQKRYLAKMSFRSQPDCQRHIGVTGDDTGSATVSAIEPFNYELMNNSTDTDVAFLLSETSTRSYELNLILCMTGVGKHNTLPFDHMTFVRIVDATRVPLDFCESILLGTPKFVHYAAKDDTQHAGFLLRTPSSKTQNWTLALSWDAGYRSIQGFIHGLLPNDLDSFSSHIGDRQEECAHPLNIPAILCEMLAESDSNGVRLHASDLYKVELQTNYSNYIFSEPVNGSTRQHESSQQNFAQMTQSLNRIISRLAFHEMRIHANIIFVDEMKDCLEQWIRHPDDTINSRLKERLAHLKIEQRGLILNIACNQKIAQSQLQIVYSLIAQRDSKESLNMAKTQTEIATAQTGIAKIQTGLAKTTKEDSFAMRTIAIMTIAFLPGTFISALFSMDMFNWQAPQGASVVSSRFWIYWAITVPLTLLVFSIWTVWIRSNDRKGDQSTATAEVNPSEKPWYRRWVHKTSDADDTEKQIESENGLQQAVIDADTVEQIISDGAVQQDLQEQDAPATSAAPPVQITRNDTLLQDPVR